MYTIGSPCGELAGVHHWGPGEKAFGSPVGQKLVTIIEEEEAISRLSHQCLQLKYNHQSAQITKSAKASERDGVSPANKLYITTFISGITITRLIKPPAAPTDLSGFW